MPFEKEHLVIQMLQSESLVLLLTLKLWFTENRKLYYNGDV